MIHKMYKKISENKFILFVLLLSLLLLVIPISVRFIKNNSYVLSSPEGYSQIKVLEDFSQNGVVNNEITILNYVLIFLSSMFNFDSIYIILIFPVICGFLTVYLVFDILKKLGLSKDTQKTYLLLYVTSPTFIYLFSIANQIYLSVFILILLFNLLLQKEKIFDYMSIFLLFLISFFGIIPVIISIIILIYEMKHRNKAGFLLIGLLVMLITFFKFNIDKLSFVIVNLKSFTLNYLISDLGYVSGFSFFTSVLILIGIFYSYKSIKLELINSKLFLLLFFGFLFFILFDQNVLFYLQFIALFYGAIGLNYIIDFHYSTDYLKYLMILMTLSLFIFSPLSYSRQMIDLYPDSNTVEAMKFLESKDGFGVFSSIRNGELLESISNKPVYINSKSYYSRDFEDKIKIMNDVYYTRKVEVVIDFMLTNKLAYVYIDEEMHNDVWLHDKQGLLYVLENTDTFSKIYDKDEIKIYSLNILAK